ncbi:hypothetical protein [Stenotrophomonas sp.]|jgi:hypothetical protein|uniref:hypothetical protein n=1 Tax=Stenotrophomonas sp. TaxID=69392 RepID=UPI0029ADA879|nr:hypothetical protein [Stenotrophomonas sp.]MDX3935783.1 hypothetical protein [Stenotrophomonas sp.]
MNRVYKEIAKTVGIYYLQAIAFALAGYLIMHLAYGGVRLSLLAWSAIVVAVFTLFYLPVLVRNIRVARAIDKHREEGGMP